MVCAIGGSSEMSQIHVQLSHFLRLLVTVGYCWVCCWGSSEMCRIWVQWWDFLTATGYCWFEVISLQKHGQLIIQSLSYTSMACATKVLLEVPADLKMLNIYLYTIDALLESAHFDYNTTFLRSHKISWDLLRSPKIFWGIIRSTEISSINWFDILHLIFDTWHLTFDIDMLLTSICCDIWQLIFDIEIEWHDTL